MPNIAPGYNCGGDYSYSCTGNYKLYSYIRVILIESAIRYLNVDVEGIAYNDGALSIAHRLVVPQLSNYCFERPAETEELGESVRSHRAFENDIKGALAEH